MKSREIQLFVFVIWETYDKVQALRSLYEKRSKSEPNRQSEAVPSPKRQKTSDATKCEDLKSDSFIELADKIMNGQIPVKTFTESSIFCSVEDLENLTGLSVSMENMQYLSIYERFKPPRGIWARLVNFFRRLFDSLKIWRKFKSKL